MLNVDGMKFLALFSTPIIMFVELIVPELHHIGFFPENKQIYYY